MLKSEGSEQATRRFFGQTPIFLRHSHIETPPRLRLFSASRAKLERSFGEGTAELPRTSPTMPWNVKNKSNFNSPFSDALGRDSEHEDSFKMTCTICHLWEIMIIRNVVIVSAKYFLNPISPEGEYYFPSIEGFISCRKATFSNNHLYADNRK